MRDEVQKDPAVFVVGGVVGLREHLRWFDARPLFGKRVLVTRSREQAGELLERLEDLGAEAIEAPFLEVAPLANAAPLDAAIAQAGQRLDRVHRRHERRALHATPPGGPVFNVRCLKGPRLCAVGLVTAERLSRFGLKVDLRFAENQASAIVDEMTGDGSLEARACSSRGPRAPAT